MSSTVNQLSLTNQSIQSLVNSINSSITFSKLSIIFFEQIHQLNSLINQTSHLTINSVMQPIQFVIISNQLCLKQSQPLINWINLNHPINLSRIYKLNINLCFSIELLSSNFLCLFHARFLAQCWEPSNRKMLKSNGRKGLDQQREL